MLYSTGPSNSRNFQPKSEDQNVFERALSCAGSSKWTSCPSILGLLLGNAQTSLRAMESGVCPFCEIGAGRTEQEIVYADDAFVAFLCEPPATSGHTLIVPRAYARDIWSVEPAEAAGAMTLAHRLAKAMRDSVPSASTSARTPA